MRHMGPRYTPGPYEDRGHIFAAGAMYSTVEDLYRWNQALSEDGLLPKDIRDQVFKPAMPDWACGWFVTKIPPGEPGAGSTMEEMRGDLPGNYFSWILRYPEQGDVIIEDIAPGNFFHRSLGKQIGINCAKFKKSKKEIPNEDSCFPFRVVFGAAHRALAHDYSRAGSARSSKAIFFRAAEASRKPAATVSGRRGEAAGRAHGQYSQALRRAQIGD